MSIILLLGGASVLGILGIEIVNAIEEIGFAIKRYKMNKNRPGIRANIRTRLLYKLESIYDYLITPR